MRSSSEPGSERPTCSGARASKATRGDRHEEREPQQSTRQKRGVEQSTAPSRAAAARDDGSSCVATCCRAAGRICCSRAQNSRPAAQWSCARGAYFPAPRGAQGAPKKWSYRWPLQAIRSTLLLVRCKGVDVDVRYANMGNSYSIMRRFTRH